MMSSNLKIVGGCAIGLVLLIAHAFWPIAYCHMAFDKHGKLHGWNLEEY